MGGSPSQKTKQSTTTILPQNQQQNVDMLLAGARDYYQTGGPQYFQGQTYAGTTPEEIQARQNASTYAGGVGQAFVDKARAGDEFWLNPENIFNPSNIPGFRESQGYVTKSLTDNLTRNIIPGITQGDVMNNGLGGSRGEIGRGIAAGETSTGIGQALSGMEMQAYGMGQNMYNAAANRAPGMYNLGLAPTDTLNQVGAANRADTQQGIDAEISKWNFEQIAPLLNLQALQSLTGTSGTYGGTQNASGSQDVSGGTDPMQLIGTVISIAAMIWSHSSLKEDIVPATGILEKLSQLNIFRWKYKDSEQAHIGPMAEQFKEIFEVGDGVTIHVFDLLGVLLGAVKELGERK